MRETLSEWREGAHRAVRESPRVVAVLGVILLLLTAGVAAQVTEETATFETGDAPGWQYADGSAPRVVENTETGVGDYSVAVEDGGEEQVDWSSGPVLDISEDFNVTGTVYNDHNGEPNPLSLGIETDGSNGVWLVFDGGGQTFLSGDRTSAPGGDTVDNSFSGEWANFRIQFEGGTLQAKVWAVGTSEPESWQLQSDFEPTTGGFSARAGQNNNGQSMRLDDVTVEGESAVDPSPSVDTLSLDTRSLFQPGATHDYTVREIRNESGRNVTYDVTENATVESLNTSLLTVNEQNNTLTATGDANVSETVAVQVSHDNDTMETEVVVSEPTVENLEILPNGTWRTSAVMTDSFLQALLVALFVGVAATRFTSAFAGLAGGQMVLVIGWFAGYVPWVYAVLGLFVALFIGLNLAANIDYTVRR